VICTVRFVDFRCISKIQLNCLYVYFFVRLEKWPVGHGGTVYNKTDRVRVRLGTDNFATAELISSGHACRQTALRARYRVVLCTRVRCANERGRARLPRGSRRFGAESAREPRSDYREGSGIVVAREPPEIRAAASFAFRTERFALFRGRPP